MNAAAAKETEVVQIDELLEVLGEEQRAYAGRGMCLPFPRRLVSELDPHAVSEQGPDERSDARAHDRLDLETLGHQFFDDTDVHESLCAPSAEGEIDRTQLHL